MISFKQWVLIVLFTIIMLVYNIPSKYTYVIKIKNTSTNEVETLNGKDIGDVYFNSHECLRAMTKQLNQYKNDSIIHNSIIIIE